VGSEPGPGQPVRLGGRLFAGTDLAVVAIAHQLPGSYPVGADVVEIAVEADAGGGVEPTVTFVRRLRESHPELVIAVRAGSIDGAERALAAGADVLAGDDPALAELAATTGAGLICADPGSAAVLGVRRDGILADAGPDTGADVDPAAIRRTGVLSAAGWPVVVTLPDRDAGGRPESGEHPDGALGGALGGALDGALAAAVVAAQNGARFFRARRTLETRQALDMLATIRGDRPPAAARRGLA
jgi:dihydropteroate synthase